MFKMAKMQIIVVMFFIFANYFQLSKIVYFRSGFENIHITDIWTQSLRIIAYPDIVWLKDLSVLFFVT